MAFRALRLASLGRENAAQARFRAALEQNLYSSTGRLDEAALNEMQHLLTTRQLSAGEALSVIKTHVKQGSDWPPDHRVRGLATIGWLVEKGNTTVSHNLMEELASPKWHERLRRIALESYSPLLQQAVAELLYSWAVRYRNHDWGVGFQQLMWDLEAEGILVEGCWKLDGPPVVVAMGGIGSVAMPGATAAAISPARPISTLPVSDDSYYPDHGSSSNTSTPGGAHYPPAQLTGGPLGGGAAAARSPTGGRGARHGGGPHGASNGQGGGGGGRSSTAALEGQVVAELSEMEAEAKRLVGICQEGSHLVRQLQELHGSQAEGAPVRRMQEDLMGVMSRGKQAASRCGVYVNRIQDVMGRADFNEAIVVLVLKASDELNGALQTWTILTRQASQVSTPPPALPTQLSEAASDGRDSAILQSTRQHPTAHHPDFGSLTQALPPPPHIPAPTKPSSQSGAQGQQESQEHKQQQSQGQGEASKAGTPLNLLEDLFSDTTAAGAPANAAGNAANGAAAAGGPSQKEQGGSSSTVTGVTAGAPATTTNTSTPFAVASEPMAVAAASLPASLLAHHHGMASPAAYSTSGGAASVGTAFTAAIPSIQLSPSNPFASLPSSLGGAGPLSPVGSTPGAPGNTTGNTAVLGTPTGAVQGQSSWQGTRASGGGAAMALWPPTPGYSTGAGAAVQGAGAGSTSAGGGTTLAPPGVRGAQGEASDGVGPSGPGSHSHASEITLLRAQVTQLQRVVAAQQAQQAHALSAHAAELAALKEKHAAEIAELKASAVSRVQQLLTRVQELEARQSTAGGLAGVVAAAPAPHAGVVAAAVPDTATKQAPGAGGPTATSAAGGQAGWVDF